MRSRASPEAYSDVSASAPAPPCRVPTMRRAATALVIVLVAASSFFRHKPKDGRR